MTQVIFSALLLLSCSLLCLQVGVRQKQAVHVLFAIFCGSMAIFALQGLGGDALGSYHYLLGMALCFTCNGSWLVARALFRQQNAIQLAHILVAICIGLLIVCSQAILLLQSLWQDFPPLLASARSIGRELLILLSSAVLMLTLWEACRGFSQATQHERKQRVIFLVTYGGAILVSGVLAKTVLTTAQLTQWQPALNATAALSILLVTQWLIYQRFARAPSTAATPQHLTTEQSSATMTLRETDLVLCQALTDLLFQQQCFLQANLRVADVARQLDVPEYKVSRILKSQFHANNFNQFINTLRIEYAKKLLADPGKGHWPIVVVGLESGFASVGPFTRAFKTIEGATPHEFRQATTAGTTVPTATA